MHSLLPNNRRTENTLRLIIIVDILHRIHDEDRRNSSVGDLRITAVCSGYSIPSSESGPGKKKIPQQKSLAVLVVVVIFLFTDTQRLL